MDCKADFLFMIQTHRIEKVEQGHWNRLTKVLPWKRQEKDKTMGIAVLHRFQGRTVEFAIIFISRCSKLFLYFLRIILDADDALF